MVWVVLGTSWWLVVILDDLDGFFVGFGGYWWLFLVSGSIWWFMIVIDGP